MAAEGVSLLFSVDVVVCSEGEQALNKAATATIAVEAITLPGEEHLL